jgi:hypothetical protein
MERSVSVLEAQKVGTSPTFDASSIITIFKNMPSQIIWLITAAGMLLLDPHRQSALC